MNINSGVMAEKLNDPQRSQMLVAGVRDYAIYMLDVDGYVDSWNAGAERFKGYLAHEIIGQHFSVFYTEDDQTAGIPAKALQTALDEGIFEAEGWRVRKDGTLFWASVVIDPIRTTSGELIGFAKVTRDITERSAARQALRESEERFRLLVQGVTDYAIYMLSPNGDVSNWNSGAQRIKGYTAAEVTGTHFSRFYTDEDQAAGVPSRALATAAKEGRFEDEGLRVRKGGSKFWAHVVIDAVYDEQRVLIGFAKVTRDITEKKHAEEVLEAANAALFAAQTIKAISEKKHADEALEQANAALFQSQKMEAIGQLTGGIAHDFNNLLAVMSTAMSVLSVRFQEPRDVKILESMQRAVKSGTTLTQQLLSFARQQPLKVARYNLNSLIGDFEVVLCRVTNSSIAFEFSLAPRLKDVSVDAARFEAAVLNLVVNARDAMPNGGRLTIVTENVQLCERQIGSLGAGAYVRISIIDTGTGMLPEVVARAFEPFFTTKGLGKGTGLGLSQVFRFISQSDGEVVLESRVDKGTTVKIYLPAIV